MIIVIIVLTICLFFSLRKWWCNYCLYMGLLSFIAKNKLHEPTPEEMIEHVAYVARKTIEDLLGKS